MTVFDSLVMAAGYGTSLVALALIVLTIWGYVSTRLNGMLLLAVWLVWNRVACSYVSRLVAMYMDRAEAAGTTPPGMTLGQFHSLLTTGQSFVGAALLAVAVVVLICEVRRLRERDNRVSQARPAAESRPA